MNGKMYAQDFGLFFMPVSEFMTTDITSAPTHRMNHNATGLQYQQFDSLKCPPSKLATLGPFSRSITHLGVHILK